MTDRELLQSAVLGTGALFMWSAIFWGWKPAALGTIVFTLGMVLAYRDNHA